MKKKISVSWSGGKDSAFALYKVLASDEFEVVNLHTVINSENRRVSMHGVHESLIEAQAASLRIPLIKLFLDPSQDHDAYTNLITGFYRQCKPNGIQAICFGDIFLEDLKQYRDKLLSATGLAGLYPLWKIDTRILIQDFINVGFRTMICSANASFFSEADLGKTINLAFIKSLPDGVDPCGENGEFHTLIYDGPIFNSPIRISLGPVIQRAYNFRILDDNGKEVRQESLFWFKELSLS